MSAARRSPERAQATVELAVLLPVIVVLLLTLVQGGLVMRDRVVAVNAVRAAARAVIVDPSDDAARQALLRQGGVAGTATVEVSGDRVPGGFATVRVRCRVTQVPIVGRAVANLVIEEALTVYVEGGG